MLQEFLDANLLPITDEGYFDKLKKTAEELTKKLSKNTVKLQSYTLASLDPDVPPDNPDILEVKEMITKNWSTFATNSKDTPITFIRAVMLEALKAVSSEIKYACLIWLSGRNVQQQFKLIGKEKELIHNFLKSLGETVEKTAIENWSLPSEAKLKKLSVGLTEFTGATIDKTTLQKLFVWASGPHDEQSVAPYKEPNQHWPSAGPPWSYSFAPKAAAAIVQEVNKVLKDQAKEINAAQVQIQEAVNKLLSQTQADLIESNSLLQMRTQLLWWKEACYSDNLHQSYRGLQNGLLQILLATDYSTFVPLIYPTSADFFLKETHRSLVKDENKKITMAEILKLVANSKENLKTVISEPPEGLGRITLLNFIRGFVWNKYSFEEFNSCLGFPDIAETTLSELTIWLFHDSQSLKILTSK
jgi:hypothetical protein